jgi:hypothetical protein
MAGGLLQLVATGVQDLYLTGNPQVSLFKVIYRRHTNFSMESVRQTIDGLADFGKSITIKVKREGDLLGRIMMEVDLPKIESTNGATIKWLNSIGHALIEQVDLYIGELLIDRHFGEWFEIWSELSLDSSKRNGYNNMIGKYETYTSNTGPFTVFVPLQFWFCRNPGLALPLVALQYHEVKIIIKFRNFDDLWTFGPNNYYVASQNGTTITKTSGPDFDFLDKNKIVYWADGTTSKIGNASDTFSVEHTDQIKTVTGGIKASQRMYIKPDDKPLMTYSILDTRVYADLIYLDTFERKFFAQNKHEYLIEQLQFDPDTNYISGQQLLKVPLSFNLPIKELIWVTQLASYTEDKDMFNFSNTQDPNMEPSDALASALVMFNGSERFEERVAGYFRLYQPYAHHTRCPSSFIYVYSFALSPEKHQPSGTANFSMLDTVDLRLKYKTDTTNSNVRVYGVNYNVLKVQSGMGGLLYAD